MVHNKEMIALCVCVCVCAIFYIVHRKPNGFREDISFAESLMDN